MFGRSMFEIFYKLKLYQNSFYIKIDCDKIKSNKKKFKMISILLY